MKVAIITDSNSGITQEEGKQLGIRIVPMQTVSPDMLRKTFTIWRILMIQMFPRKVLAPPIQHLPFPSSSSPPLM
jgi:hypothetical protein